MKTRSYFVSYFSNASGTMVPGNAQAVREKPICTPEDVVDVVKSIETTWGLRGVVITGWQLYEEPTE
jgi:hypothetical protein